MGINGLTDGGALPAIEAMARFTAARQRLIANNVANLDTPGFSPMDADPEAFQAQIGRAIDARRDNDADGFDRSGRIGRDIVIRGVFPL